VHSSTWLGAYLPPATAGKVWQPRPARQLELLVERVGLFVSDFGLAPSTEVSFDNFSVREF
jgi:hypothetical protein